MHPITRTEEPNSLKRYREKSPQNEWHHLRRNVGIRQDIVNAMYEMQNGLCAYCEEALESSEHQVEHFYPKSKIADGYNPNLDWDIMLLCCDGGKRARAEQKTIAATSAENELPDSDTVICCGQKKDNHVFDAELSPTKWKFPLVRARIRRRETVEKRSSMLVREVKIVPWKDMCNEAGIDCKEIEKMIDVLGLNCPRLLEQRAILYDNLIKTQMKISKDKLDDFLKKYLLPNVEGKLRRFWTTSRSFFGVRT